MVSRITKNLYRFALLLIMGSLFVSLLSVPREVFAAPVSSVASDYGIATDTSGKAQDLENAYQVKWINAGLMKLSFKTKPGVELDLVPASGGNNGMSGLLGQRNGWANHLEEHYVVSGWPESCWNKIYLNPNDGDMVNGIVKSVDINIDFSATSSGGCIDAGGRIRVSTSGSEYSTSYFRWLDSAQIETIQHLDINVSSEDKGTSTFQQLPTLYKQDPNKKNVFVAADEANLQCKDSIIVDKAANTMKFFLLSPNGLLKDGNGYSSQHDSTDVNGAADVAIPGCTVVDFRENFRERSFKTDNYVQVPPQSNHTYTIANPENSNKPANSGTQSTSPLGAVNPDENVDPSCESSSFTLSWITCGIINGLAGVTQGVFDSFIEPYLKTAPINTDSDPTNPIFKVWSSMRNIANIIIIFALLAIVFSQSIGGGLIDAYTAKKIMPRLLASAVLINISIYVVAIMIDLFNVLGNGIGNLILGPFKNTIFTKFNNTGNDRTIGVAAILALVIGGLLAYLSVTIFRAGGKTGAGGLSAAGSAFWPFFHFILIFVLIPAALITLAIFATLIIRQGIILVLVVTAPVAFALFAIPSTEKYFKKWWSTLITTLMVYPIMTVIFSASIILAALSYNNVTDGDFLAGIIGALVAFIILIVPMLMIPFSFKLAGGILGNLFNKAQGLSGKGGGFGKNRYKEQKAMERKNLFEDKWKSGSTGLQKRIAAKGTGRPKVASRVAGWGSRPITRGPAKWVGKRLNNGTAPPSVEALNAGADAEAAALAAGAAAPMARAARLAAVNAHTAAAASGSHSPEAVQVAARAAGVAAARGANAAAAGAASAQAYDTQLAATGNAAAASVGAAVAGSTAGSGAGTEASASAARVAAQKFSATRTRLGDGEATKLANAAGESAALAHSIEARRNGNNHTLAATEADSAGDNAQTHYESALRATGNSDAAHTAALAGTEAQMHRDAAGNRVSPTIIVRAASEAATVHQTASLGGRSADQARLDGLQHGRTIR